ncbi:TPP-dependent indolepyruvate ferredoxin oxidoreductase alpha subunit [Clostridiales Family XIII bacterium PM5-7]
MELINGYWTDSRGNKWDSIYFSENKAFLFSSSLINCENCTNCLHCTNCFECVSCKHCSNCRNCKGCEHCEYLNDGYMISFVTRTKGGKNGR